MANIHRNESGISDRQPGFCRDGADLRTRLEQQHPEKDWNAAEDELPTCQNDDRSRPVLRFY